MATWTIDTMAAHFLGSIVGDRNAAGGTVPDRLGEIIRESYEDLWEREDWRFRIRRTTLAFAAGTATATLPADFEKFCTNWMRESNVDANVTLAANEGVMEQYLQVNDEQGTPYAANVESIDSSGYREQLRISPTPDEAVSFPIVYIATAPTLADEGYPLWPKKFHRAWYLRAKAFVLGEFKRGSDAWETPYKQFLNWLERALDEDDPSTGHVPVIEDAHGDLEALTSTRYAVGSAGKEFPA